MSNLTNNQTGKRAPQVGLALSLLEKRDFKAILQLHQGWVTEGFPIGGADSGIFYRVVAVAQSSLGDTTAALKSARMAQHILSDMGETTELAELFFVLGNILRKRDEFKEAEKSFRDSESLFRRTDHAEGQARALNALAGLFFRQHDHRNALAVLMDGLEIARRLGDTAKIAFMTGNIGRIHLFCGNLREARKYLTTNAELSRELHDETELARVYLSLAYASMQLGEFGDAERELAHAGTSLRTSQDKRDQVYYLCYMGELRRRSGALIESRDHLTEALSRARLLESGASLELIVLRQLAETTWALGDGRKVRSYLQRALTLSTDKAGMVDRAGCLRLMALVTESESGSPKESADYWQQSLRVVHESGVRFEEAETCFIAGKARSLSTSRRINLLIQAEDYYTAQDSAYFLEGVALAMSQLESSAPRPTEQTLAKTSKQEHDYLTRCEAIEQIKREIVLVGHSPLPILITGETGVGKDHMARFFHARVKPGTPFVAINCTAMPETLLESELFGYHKGAFTGAGSDKMGLLVAANGGVLFLDEIGDMPLSLQAKLLGVLERRSVVPLGTTREVTLDFKLICATNRDLEKLVAEGLFRQDLYYRISGATYHIPPLRDRMEDVPLLVEQFIEHGPLGQQGFKVTAELIQLFLSHTWPGNTRELYHRVKRLEIQAQAIGEGDLAGLARPIFSIVAQNRVATLFSRVEQFERQLIVEALSVSRGNKSEAARYLGIHEATMRAKMKRYNIAAPGGGLAN